MILGFKGFKPGLIATLGDGSYQYQPGEVSKTEKAKCANTGFHYCLDPLDCLNWYAWDGKNEFWAIAAGGDIDEDDYRTRSSCTEIVPLRRLKEDEFLLMHANYAFEHLRCRNEYYPRHGEARAGDNLEFLLSNPRRPAGRPWR